jgi:hypothetical protein
MEPEKVCVARNVILEDGMDGKLSVAGPDGICQNAARLSSPLK